MFWKVWASQDRVSYMRKCRKNCQNFFRAHMKKIKPVALLEFGNLKEHSVMRNGRRMTEVLYGLCSIGHEMSSWSTQLFAEGDYVKGMLVDAIADDYLFQMDRKLEGTVIELCKNKKKGIAGRIEAPKDIPMSIRRKSFLAVHAEKEGIRSKKVICMTR